MIGLEEKVVLVTGGGQGLGAAISRTLAHAGARVAIADLKAENAQRLAKELGAEGGSAHGLGLDVANEEQAREAIEAAVSLFGRLDILVNNAGTDVTLPIDDLAYSDWNRVIQTNLYGPFILSKYAAQQFKRQGGCGQIVNIASTAAKRTWPNAAAYHASKWGLLGLSHALHAELRPHRIKVTAIIAGGMRTPFLLDRFPDLDPAVLQDPVNVAETVRFVLTLPEESVIPEVMVIPMRESSWP